MFNWCITTMIYRHFRHINPLSIRNISALSRASFNCLQRSVQTIQSSLFSSCANFTSVDNYMPYIRHFQLNIEHFNPLRSYSPFCRDMCALLSKRQPKYRLSGISLSLCQRCPDFADFIFCQVIETHGNDGGNISQNRCAKS